MSVAAQHDFSDSDALGRWITYYYTAPEPELVGKAYLAASNQGLLKDEKVAPPFFGFLAGILAKNRDIAAGLTKELSALPSGEQQVVVLSVWYSGRSDAKALLADLAAAMPERKRMIDFMLRSEPSSIIEIPLEQGPWVLDALWGNFMATGDAAPVERIMTALPWAEIKGDIPRLLVGGSARWSLISNAVQHPRVLSICREETKSRSPEVMRALKEVIASAEEELRKRDASESRPSIEGTK